ncbi:hypothetical protein ACOMHN_057291 [Nucella lapillus]
MCAADKCTWEDHRDKVGVGSVSSYLASKKGVRTGYACKDLCTQTYGCVSVDWKAHYLSCTLYKTAPTTKYHKGSLYSSHKCSKEPCTYLKRWCIKGAQCVNRTCVCPPDAPTGDGAFDCVSHYKDVCMVNCDPKLTTWDGSTVPVNLPCWYRLTDFYVHNPALKYYYNKCRVQVQALNQLTSRGLFFVRRVLIKVWLGRQRQAGLYSWPLYSSYAFDLDHAYVWKAMKSYDSVFDKRPVQRLLDLTILRDLDREDRFAVVQFKECWVRIKFRPFDPNTQPQEHKPGVTIAIPKKAEFYEGNKMFSVCLTPGSGPTAYQDHAKHHGLKSGEELVLHNILLAGVNVQKKQIFHEHRDQCVGVVETFTSERCQPFRVFTIHLCGPILNHRRMIYCFKSREVDPMEVFKACVEWGCAGDVQQCNRYSDHLYHCPTTAFMRQVGCDPAARLTHNLKFYNVTADYQQQQGYPFTGK